MFKENNYFVAVYTNEVKDYCDQEFFTRASLMLRPGSELWVVDNSTSSLYEHLLNNLLDSPCKHIDVPVEPKRTQFLRNVTESVNKLREYFLVQKKLFDHFLILESDVMPPHNLLTLFDATIASLPEDWGIIGGRYYQGFHDYSKVGIQQTHHVLSGCTVYNKSLIETTPFRWSEENLGAFPDAWMSVDAGQKGYKLYNNYDIRCEHQHAGNGTRQSKSL